MPTSDNVSENLRKAWDVLERARKQAEQATHSYDLQLGARPGPTLGEQAMCQIGSWREVKKILLKYKETLPWRKKSRE